MVDFSWGGRDNTSHIETQVSTHLLRFPANLFPTRPGASFFISGGGLNIMEDKDIRFVDKKIDESWKEQAVREKERNQPPLPNASSSHAANLSEPKSPQTSLPFLNFLKSLGYQAMIHLGEIPHPATGRRETDIEAARETIDLLRALQDKTGPNTSPEELEIFQGILPELQLKFAEKS